MKLLPFTMKSIGTIRLLRIERYQKVRKIFSTLVSVGLNHIFSSMLGIENEVCCMNSLLFFKNSRHCQFNLALGLTRSNVKKT